MRISYNLTSESLFFALFRVLLMLVAVNKAKFSLRKTLINFKIISAKECGLYKMEFTP